MDPKHSILKGLPCIALNDSTAVVCHASISYSKEISCTTDTSHSKYGINQSELPRPIKIRPRMYVRRSIMYENSPEE